MAALGALARGGVTAVAVEPLAAELGVSRGSFYWHFTDRAELVAAALDYWATAGTTKVIERLCEIEDPGTRLSALFEEAFGDEVIAGLEPALLASADHPLVAPALTWVTDERIRFLAECYADLGMPRSTARRQAVVTYAAYLGWFELRRAAPAVVPEVAATGRPARAALTYLLDQLVHPAAIRERASATPSEVRRPSTRRRAGGPR